MRRWRQLAAQHGQQRVAAEHSADQVAHSHLLKRTLRHWRSAAVDEQRRRQQTLAARQVTLDCMQTRRTLSQLRLCIRAWRAETVRQLDRLEVARVAFAARRDDVIRNVYFAAWIHRVLSRKRVRSRARQVAQQWHTWAQRRTRLREVAAVVRGQHTAAVTRRAALRWRSTVAMARQQRQWRLESEARRKQIYFNVWRIHTNELVLARDRAEQLRRRHLSRTVVLVLLHWRRAAHEAAERERYALQRLKALALRRRLQQWRGAAVNRRAQRARAGWLHLHASAMVAIRLRSSLAQHRLAAALCRTRDRRQLLSAFQGWQSLARRQLAARRRADELRRMTQARHLRVLIAAWRAAVDEATCGRAAAGRMRLARQWSVAICAFTAWREHTASTRRRVAHLRQMLPVLEARLAAAKTARLWQLWRQALANRLQDHRAHQLQLLAARWHEYVKMRRLRQACQQWQTQLRLARQLEIFRRQQRIHWLCRWRAALAAVTCKRELESLIPR